MGIGGYKYILDDFTVLNTLQYIILYYAAVLASFHCFIKNIWTLWQGLEPGQGLGDAVSI